MADYWWSGGGVGVTLALLTAVAAPGGAQTYHACFVRGTGTVYRIKEAGLVQTDCRKDVPFNGTDDGIDHGRLAGLGDDDHLQYLLTNGVRQTVSGFAVTGSLAQGEMPITGSGIRLVWYPGLAAFRAGGVNGPEWNASNVGQYSTATGGSTQASGPYSTAMGAFTTASGANSTAMGNHTAATGDDATAIGSQTVASGPNSTAMGQLTHAEGYRSTAMGGGTVASGGASTAMGENTTASGAVATAMGSQTVASGLYSTAMGRDTRAGGDYSIAMGSSSSASGNNSTAIGSSATASGIGSLAINGGTASGTGSVAINSGTASGAGALAFGQTTASGNFSVAMGYNASTNGQAGSFVFGDRPFIGGDVQATAPNQFVVRASGGFQFRTSADLSTGCNLPPSSGSWDCSSSVMLKTAFESVDGEDILARVRQLPVQRWSYRGELGVRHMGAFAEDFRRAFGLGTGDKTIGMIDMDGVNLAAAQALERRTRDLRDQLTQRDREIAELRGQVADLVLRVERLEAARR